MEINEFPCKDCERHKRDDYESYCRSETTTNLDYLTGKWYYTWNSIDRVKEGRAPWACNPVPKTGIFRRRQP